MKEPLRRNRDIRKFLQAMIVARLVIVTVFLGIGIYILYNAELKQILFPFVVLLGVTYFFSILYEIFFLRSVSYNFLFFLQTAVDIVLTTYMVYITGGYFSPFSFFYLLPIIGVSFFRPYVSIVAAGVSGISYAALLYLQRYSVLIFPSFVSEILWTSEDMYGKVYIHFTLFFIVALIGDYFARALRKNRQDLFHVRDLLMRAHLDKDDILKNISSGLMTVDRNGTVIYFNQMAESILDVPAGEAINRSCEECFGDRLSAFSRKVASALESGLDQVRSELEIECLSGERRPVGISITLLRAENGEKRGAIALFQDLTDIKKLEEKMRKKDLMAMIGELSAGIAHEIRNPLASISGSIEILKEDLVLSANNNSLMNLLIKESERLDTIISNFLDFARIKPMNFGLIPVEEILDEVLLLVGNHPSYNSGISLNRRYQKHRNYIFADEDQIKQVFLNLAINAIQAMEAGGVLTITVKRHPAKGRYSLQEGEEGGKIDVIFSDTGRGIDEVDRLRIFEPFFTTKEKGTGLGLAIVQRIVESHHGEIQVQSRPGMGTTCTILLPEALVSPRRITV